MRTFLIPGWVSLSNTRLSHPIGLCPILFVPSPVRSCPGAKIHASAQLCTINPNRPTQMNEPRAGAFVDEQFAAHLIARGGSDGVATITSTFWCALAAALPHISHDAVWFPRVGPCLRILKRRMALFDVERFSGI